jgi:uncharacterized protein (TIGR03000 family)
MPPAMQPQTPMQPLNPIISLPNMLSNPWLQNGYMMNGYGYSMPYTVPGITPNGGYQPEINPEVNHIEVQLPIANARIWINGVETKGAGQSTRRLTVPNVATGQNQEIKIKATWMIDGKTKSEERTIRLKGCGRQVVNFLVPEGK